MTCIIICIVIILGLQTQMTCIYKYYGGIYMKKILLVLTLFLAVFSLAACNNEGSDNEKPRVQATLFPQYDMARALAGDYIDLEFVVPAGVSAHNYEPGPRKVIQILESDLLLYTGDLMEPWVSRLIADDANSQLRLLDLSENVLLLDESQRIDEDDHNHVQGDIGVFEILNRRNDEDITAYVDGDHWHGSLPNIEVGSNLSLGAYIESSDGRHRELDSEGAHNGFKVRLDEGAEEGIVEFVQHGDHVHINGVSEGTTEVVFSWTHDGEVRYETPPMEVSVGDSQNGEDEHAHDDDHDHDDGDIDTFEILNRQNDGAKIAYVHGAHWHGILPNIEVGSNLSLGAYIESSDGRHRELDSEGAHNGFRVRLHEGAEEGIVEFVQHGDHVHINGVSEGVTQVVFKWTHDGEVRYETPPMNVTVSDEASDDGHNHGVLDPHFWLDPLNAEQMVLDVRDALINLLPEHEEEIKANAMAYMDELESLHEEMLVVRENVEHSIVMHGGHNAFNYFMSRYNIEYVTPYRGYSTDAEPTPGAIQEMIDNMENYNVNYLFSERLVSESVANTISEETGAEILYIYDGENAPVDEFNDGITFIDMMRHNIEQYKIGLNFHE